MGGGKQRYCGTESSEVRQGHILTGDRQGISKAGASVGNPSFSRCALTAGTKTSNPQAVSPPHNFQK